MRHHGSRATPAQNARKECFFCSATSKLKLLPVAHRGMKEVCPDCEDLTDIYVEVE
jgi:hypothetical protein